jgi:hypothetical protein
MLETQVRTPLWAWALDDDNKDYECPPLRKRKRGSRRDDARDKSVTTSAVVPSAGDLKSFFVREYGDLGTYDPSESEMQSYYAQCEEKLDEVQKGKHWLFSSRLGLDLIGKQGVSSVPFIPEQNWSPDSDRPTSRCLAEYMHAINWQNTGTRRASGNPDANPMYRIDNYCHSINAIRAYSLEQIGSLRHKGDDAAACKRHLKSFDHEKIGHIVGIPCICQ